MGKTIGWASAAIISTLTGCESPVSRTPESQRRLANVRKAASSQRESLKKRSCYFINPDTSINGVKIRDAESATAFVANSQLDSLGQYHFYSKLEAETLTLVQYPGDARNQISVIKVTYSDKASYNYRQVQSNAFVTEKGIKLGMTKKELVEKLGTCYAVLDSTNNFMELFYKLEKPNDSKTRLLATNDMPVYYASYKLCDGKLTAMEFGFEYP